MLKTEQKTYKPLRPELNKQYLLLPLISRNGNDVKKWITRGFLGVYFKDTNKPQWENKIIVVYDGATHDIHSILNWCNSKYSYEKYEQIKDGKIYCIYAYTVPPKYKQDFKKIINGDYSKVSASTVYDIKNYYTPLIKGNKTLYDDITKILRPPTLCTKNYKGEYTDAFGGRQILNINSVPIEEC